MVVADESYTKSLWIRRLGQHGGRSSHGRERRGRVVGQVGEQRYMRRGKRELIGVEHSFRTVADEQLPHLLPGGLIVAHFGRGLVDFDLADRGDRKLLMPIFKHKIMHAVAKIVGPNRHAGGRRFDEQAVVVAAFSSVLAQHRPNFVMARHRLAIGIDRRVRNT